MLFVTRSKNLLLLLKTYFLAELEYKSCLTHLLLVCYFLQYKTYLILDLEKQNQCRNSNYF
jgi:hypothetical protein